MPLSVGRATRTIPAPIRTALHLRDQGCHFPGCDRPPAWTDGHHIIHWSDGGPTELENLVHRRYNPLRQPQAELRLGVGHILARFQIGPVKPDPALAGCLAR